MNQASDINRLASLLDAIEARAQVGLDGNGARPWPQEHLREIMREIRDLAQLRHGADEEDA
jgi:hypothetical protein